ncbi:MAG: hypothetical protein ACYDH1_17760 [Anaerolineaceae bacterium]
MIQIWKGKHTLGISGITGEFYICTRNPHAQKTGQGTSGHKCVPVFICTRMGHKCASVVNPALEIQHLNDIAIQKSKPTIGLVFHMWKRNHALEKSGRCSAFSIVNCCILSGFIP